MSRFPRRVTLSLLAAMLALNLALRYPGAPHETGVDSFIFHGLGQTAVDQGRAVWLLNPLSLFGLYPLSHPAGSVILVAATSSAGGIPIEGSVLLLDFVICSIGLLGAFLMAREIKPDDRFGLLVAFLMSTAPRFVSSLSWEMPTRSMFTALVPIFVWAVLRLHRRVGSIDLAVLGTILVVMMTAHRLTVVMAIVLIAYIVASIFLVFARLLRTAYSSTFLRRPIQRATRVAAWSLLGIAALYVIGLSDVLGAYERGQVGTGSGILAQIQNLGVSLARSAGLLLPLGILGVVAVVRSRAKDIREPWLIATMVGILPTLALRQYTGYYFVPFAAIFVGLGMLYLHQALRKHPRVRSAVATGLLAFSLASTLYVVNYEVDVEQYLSTTVYDGGIYLRHMGEGTFVANSGIVGVQMHAISGVSYMPIGGATTASQGPEILVFGFMRPEEMQVRLIPIGSLTIEDDSFFVLDDVNFEVIWATLMSTPVSDMSARRDLARYGIEYFVASRELPQSFEAYGKIYESKFAASVEVERYVAYSSAAVDVYVLGGHGG